MNKNRRKELEAYAGALEVLKNQVSKLLEDEEEYYDNVPENLQGGERYQASEEAIEYMQNAIDNLEDAIDNLKDAAEV